MIIRLLHLMILLIGFSSYGQEIRNTSEIEVSTIWFKGNSTRLSNNAKYVLDSLIVVIKNKPELHILVTSYSKDFCDQCGARSWDRSASISSYLVKHGIPERKINLTSRLDGELNKVTLSLTISSRDNNTAPHPNLRQLKKQLPDKLNQ